MRQNFWDELSKDYELITKTQHHIQIKTVDGMHNIYIDKNGGIKFQPYGQQQTHIVSEKQLRSELANYKYESSDLAYMQRLSIVMKKAAGKTGIFCDAGFSENRAKVAVIRANKGDYDISVRQIEVESPYHAEDRAIKMALEMYPGDEPVFSDCKQAVIANQLRAQWIPREDNQQADRFGNMRKQK